MNPLALVAFLSLAKALVEVLEKELSDDEKKEVEVEAEKLAANFTKKESEIA
jgi:hypothetical protein